MTADIALIGLAVMGQNLVLNLNDHGFRVIVYNRTSAKTTEFLQGPAKNTLVMGAHSIEELVAHLKKPRKIILMVKAGTVVDQFIEQLLLQLEPGDILIDGGNSHYLDTNRRTQFLTEKGILYVGTGISGGEEGARFGPSIMPGGNPAAWGQVKPILQAIAAKVEGEPCCQWVGEAGAGHYVKMVHNGIEYGDMQLIAEAYQLLRRGLGLSVAQLHEVFAEWNQGVLESYLIEITGKIIKFRDSDGQPLIDKIRDSAGQKGTGKWTGIEALEVGVPLTLITEAVFARSLSALKDERLKAASYFEEPPSVFPTEQEIPSLVKDIQDALYASKIISYTQGYMLLRQAAREYHWQLNYGEIALMWRGGCIIRSQFLGKIKQAFSQNSQLENLLLDEFFAAEIRKALPGWRKTMILAIKIGIPMPAFSSALAFYDGYRSQQLPANLLQAQRDYFGAHTYERIDRPVGEFFHTDWTGQGGKVTSTTYQV